MTLMRSKMSNLFQGVSLGFTDTHLYRKMPNLLTEKLKTFSDLFNQLPHDPNTSQVSIGFRKDCLVSSKWYCGASCNVKLSVPKFFYLPRVDANLPLR